MSFSELKSRYAAGALGKPDFIREALQHHRALFGYAQLLRETDVREIRITPEGVCFVVGDEGIRLLTPPDEARVAPIEVLNFGRYEPAETAVMDRLAAGARQILDIGANIGWHAVRFALREPAARVAAFEPLPTSHAYLQRNIALNNMGARVTAFNYGLSERSGPVEFFIAPANGTNASLLNVAGREDARPVLGLTLTLDQWVANHGTPPDFIKCDVEGAELLVFRGGIETLKAHRPVVFTEMLRKWSRPFGYQPDDMIGFFAALGYVCIAVGSEGCRRLERVDEDTVETNYAFLHATQHRAQLERLEAGR